MVPAVARGVEAMRRSVIEEWSRSGTAGVREVAWALPPEDQVRLFVTLFNHREIEPLVAGIQQSFVHDMRPTGIPGMEVYRGPGGYGRFISEWLDAFPDASIEIQSVELMGEALIAVIDQKVHGAGSGAPAAFTYAAVLTFEDGRAATSEFHLDLDASRARFGELATEARARGECKRQSPT
jgi:SnoaL-like domain